VAAFTGAAELVAGVATSVELDPTGTPTRPIRVVDLTRPVDGDVELVAAALAGMLPLVVGVADGPIAPGAEALLDALTLTVTSRLTTAGRRGVVATDVGAEVARVVAAVERHPRAALALGQVLRAASVLPVRAALAGEAAAYSMLLAGPEFAAWRASRPINRPTDQAEPRVTVTRDNDILRVSLSRPSRRNAVDAAMREALVEALAVATADLALAVTVVGEGPDFCSGGDLDEFGTATDVGAAYLVRLDRHPGWLLHLLRDRTRVTVHGACIGAGIELPAFAGRVVARPTAYFGLPEVDLGLIPGAGGTASITRRIGRWRTAWLALTGQRIDADRALEWGLVDEIEDP
jgi:Enoyl-CoA hydratase/isomerase